MTDLKKAEWLSTNYDSIRQSFEEDLAATGRYDGKNLSEIDDGRDGYVNHLWAAEQMKDIPTAN